MGKNTKIIEFYGLPASGKSTLAGKIKEYLEKEGKKVAVWNDLTSEFKSASIVKMISSFSIIKFMRYLYLFTKLKHSKYRKFYYYWFSIKISLLYNFVKKYSDYDYVLIDHGIIQHFNSLQCGESIKKNNDFRKIAKDIISVENTDCYVDCIVDIDTAFKRMRKRNRTNEGRLDKIENDNVLISEFSKDEENLKILTEDIKSIKKINILNISTVEVNDLLVSECITNLREKL